MSGRKGFLPRWFIYGVQDGDYSIDISFSALISAGSCEKAENQRDANFSASVQWMPSQTGLICSSGCPEKHPEQCGKLSTKRQGRIATLSRPCVQVRKYFLIIYLLQIYFYTFNKIQPCTQKIGIWCTWQVTLCMRIALTLVIHHLIQELTPQVRCLIILSLHHSHPELHQVWSCL